MTDISIEIARLRQERARAASLRAVARSRCRDLLAEMQRGKNLLIIADEILTPSIHAILVALPQDGSWASGGGRHWRLISDLLDEGSPFLEEDTMPTDGDAPWRVRLTIFGIAAIAGQPPAQVICANSRCSPAINDCR